MQPRMSGARAPVEDRQSTGFRLFGRCANSSSSGQIARILVPDSYQKRVIAEEYLLNLVNTFR